MKSTLVASSIAAAALAATSVQAADVWAGLDFKSAYTATGATCNDGWVAQPCVDVYGLKVGEVAIPVTLEFWGNIDLEEYSADDESRADRFQEIDLAATLNLGGYIDDALTLDVGYLEYDYPNHHGESDHLLTAKVGYEIGLGEGCGSFTPSVVAKYRVAGPSKYKCEWGFDFCYSVGLGEVNGWAVTFKLDNDYWYVDNSGRDRDEEGYRPDSGFACSDLTAKLSVGCFYAGVQRIFRLDHDALDKGPWGYDVKTIGMFGVSYDF